MSRQEGGTTTSSNAVIDRVVRVSTARGLSTFRCRPRRARARLLTRVLCSPTKDSIGFDECFVEDIKPAREEDIEGKKASFQEKRGGRRFVLIQ